MMRFISCLPWFQVVVTEVVSPATIWCQIVDKENIEPLQEVMGKMAEVS